MGLARRDQGARRRRCGDIVDDEQRRDRPQPPCALRVPAAREHLLCWRSSTMPPHRLRRAALHLLPRRSERGLLHFHRGLLEHLMEPVHSGIGGINPSTNRRFARDFCIRCRCNLVKNRATKSIKQKLAKLPIFNYPEESCCVIC